MPNDNTLDVVCPLCSKLDSNCGGLGGESVCGTSDFHALDHIFCPDIDLDLRFAF